MKRATEKLASHIPCGYTAGEPPATEPTAWTGLALAASGDTDSAVRAGEWIAEFQSTDGSVGTDPQNASPCWTTSLAILLWQYADVAHFRGAIHRALEWTLATKGKTAPRNANIGHDTTLEGWSWADGTHSWLEPTAFAILALRASGHAEHERAREAVQMLVDRLLPSGGCNYGNTQVLGQYLVPHLQPTGIVLWALAGVGIDDPRIEKAIEYAGESLTRRTGAASLAYALLGLSAWGRRPKNADALLAEALRRPATDISPYRLALLSLAAQTTNANFGAPTASQ